jgi:hypothetical protein
VLAFEQGNFVDAFWHFVAAAALMPKSPVLPERGPAPRVIPRP